MSDELLASSADGVLTLTINRPERRNALSWDVITGLRAAVAAAKDDAAVVDALNRNARFIRGRVSPEEAVALHEEGIETVSLPPGVFLDDSVQ